MRTKTLFALAFAGLVLAGCAKDNPREGRNDNGGNARPDGGWMSLKISTPKTRAATGDTELGTESEMTVNSLKVILFDVGNNVSDIYDVGFTPTGTMITSDPFQITTDAMSILVVLNHNGMFDWVGGGTSFIDVNRAISVSSVDEVINNGFMMTNASGALEGGNIQDYTKATADAASRAPFTLNVDRVVSKVRLYMNAIPDGELQFDPISAEWGLNVTNKLFYPVSERIQTFLENQWGYNPTYRFDPNFDGPDFFNTPEYDENFFYAGPRETGNYSIDWRQATNANNTADPNQPENPGGNQKVPVWYCLENTFSEFYSYHAYTTQAVVRLNVYPQQVELPDSGIMPVNAGEDWMLIAGARYSFESLMQWIENHLNNGIFSLADAFNGYLSHIGEAPVNLFNDIGTVMNDFRNKELTLQSHGGDAYGAVTYYGDGGKNYYKIMIKHDNIDDELTVNQLGEFGVVRNSVYDININSINTPGYPYVPAPDPNVPNEEENRYLSVSIDINPWAWYTQDEDL